MSAGSVHTKASVILAGAFTLSAVVSGNYDLMQCAVGSLIGIIVTPDIDVDAGFDGDKHIRKRLGKWAENVWDRTWHFYRRSIKHGSELSHFPIIGTLGRIAYLYLFAIVIPTVILSWVFPEMNIMYELAWWFQKIVGLRIVIMGLMGADLIHWGLDILTTEHVGKTQKHGLLRKLRRQLR